MPNSDPERFGTEFLRPMSDLLLERVASSGDEVAYVELSGRADFNDLFIDQLQFPG